MQFSVQAVALLVLVSSLNAQITEIVTTTNENGTQIVEITTEIETLALETTATMNFTTTEKVLVQNETTAITTIFSPTVSTRNTTEAMESTIVPESTVVPESTMVPKITTILPETTASETITTRGNAFVEFCSSETKTNSDYYEEMNLNEEGDSNSAHGTCKSHHENCINELERCKTLSDSPTDPAEPTAEEACQNNATSNFTSLVNLVENEFGCKCNVTCELDTKCELGYTGKNCEIFIPCSENP